MICYRESAGVFKLEFPNRGVGWPSGIYCFFPRIVGSEGELAFSKMNE
jgi:hypothetical protein